MTDLPEDYFAPKKPYASLTDAEKATLLDELTSGLFRADMDHLGRLRDIRDRDPSEDGADMRQALRDEGRLHWLASILVANATLHRIGSRSAALESLQDALLDVARGASPAAQFIPDPRPGAKPKGSRRDRTAGIVAAYVTRRREIESELTADQAYLWAATLASGERRGRARPVSKSTVKSWCEIAWYGSTDGPDATLAPGYYRGALQTLRELSLSSRPQLEQFFRAQLAGLTASSGS